MFELPPYISPEESADYIEDVSDPFSAYADGWNDCIISMERRIRERYGSVYATMKQVAQLEPEYLLTRANAEIEAITGIMLQSKYEPNEPKTQNARARLIELSALVMTLVKLEFDKEPK